ncbi:efflux transporter outer membrane subunit [Dyella telluris]|uniref:Efflux transporter outer membrane subunit n=1 Tax=Dyella telluris TaxID=2763498 RepID=A0A7G8Q3X5_9GAMM|nr:efflux transporter outer membrane subunit [Dyella telluris]QNK01483.1 efflux transporter outer membrane subunit [Dyella telluris]
MRSFALPAAIAFSLVLAGCATSRGLHTTGTLTDPGSLKSERSLADVQLSPTAWPAQDWWVSYGDPQLTALIDEALKNNPSLDQAQARARQAQAIADGVNSARKPQANFDAAMTGAYLSKKNPIYPEYVLGKFAWSKSLTADFSWDLDLWGGKRAAWEGALGRSRAAEIEAHAARIELSVNVARAYVQLSYAFAAKDVADAEFERANRTLDVTRKLVKGGLGTPQQEHFADSQVAGAEQQKVAADRAIDAARSSLSVLLGQGPDRGLAIERPHLTDLGPAVLPDKLPVDLLGRRADLVAARWEIEAANKDVKAAKKDFLPNISVSAMAGLIAVGASTNVLSMQARQYAFGPALSLPLFDGGRRRAHLAVADAEYDAMVARYNGLLISSLNEVSDQVSALASVRQQIVLEKRSMDDAQKSWDDALKAYQGGLKGPLTPLTSRQQLLTAQQRLALLESQQNDISIRLIEALGGGFDGSNDVAQMNEAAAAAPQASGHADAARP